MVKTKKYQKSTFAINAIEERKKLGMSGIAFAEFAKISHSTLADIEAGMSGGSPTTKRKIAEALKTTVDELNTPRALATSAGNKADLLTRLYAIAPTLDESKLRSIVLSAERLAHGPASDSALVSDKLKDKTQ